MSSDASGLRDSVSADLNGSALTPDYGPQPAPIPVRPADSAAKEKWAAYVTALGMHPDQVGDYSRPELITLADRFGG